MSIVTQGLGGAGVIASYGYGDLLEPIVILEFRGITCISFVKVPHLFTFFVKTNPMATIFERVIESEQGNIPAPPPPAPTPTVDVIELEGTFVKTPDIAIEFMKAQPISFIFEQVIQSVQGTIPPGSPPTPTPTVDVIELESPFLKANGLIVIFEKTENLSTEFRRSTEI